MARILNHAAKRSVQLADEIVGEFDRLKVGIDENPFSGLTAEALNVNANACLVKVYDDYASGLYRAEPLLGHLKTLQATTFEDIWEDIKPFEVK